jgi:D-threonate/D-erythronate kinase
VDTDSRELAAAEAAERVAAVAESLKGVPIILKKIDSTLRGPIAAELRAAMRASGRTRLVVAPAFPATGRTTRGGVQHVGGRALADVGEVVGREDVTVLSRGESPEPALRAHECVVADAEEDADLAALVRGVPDAGEVLWVGSAGLAAALAAAHPGRRRATEPPPAAPDEAVLVVIGSANPIARTQVRRLAAASGVVEVPLSLDLLAGGRGGEAVQAAVATAGQALRASGCALVHATASAGDGVSHIIPSALADVVARLGDQGTTPALVLSGGETAIHVLRVLQARGMLIERELEPGVVVSRLIGPQPCRVVSKAGGFGDAMTLVNVVEALGQRVGELR